MRSAAINRGFTLIELLVVVAIVGVLVALLLPAAQAAREAARRTQCANNLKQIAIATHGYHDVNNSFPSQIGFLPRSGTPSDHRIGWMLQILPNLEGQTQFDSYNFTQGPGPYPDVPAFSPKNRTVIEVKIGTYLCPSYAGPVALKGQADFIPPA